MLLDLQPYEHDFQEFKSSPYMVDEKGIAQHFVQSLSKQVSAFANGGGGRLFIGLRDDGSIDGGVSISLKGGGTRAWLEDIIPGTVDPPLKAFNVFEVHGRTDGPSAIPQGYAVYVIDLEASAEAPHQGTDNRYYLRIAGKSRPMGHVHLADVLRRTRHPVVSVARVSPFGAPEPGVEDPRGPKSLLCFQVYVANTGRRLAHHVGVELVIPRPLINSEARERFLAGGDVQITQTPGALTFFRYHPTPLFPGQEVMYLRFWISLHANNLEAVRTNPLSIEWRVYADDAPARIGSIEVWEFPVAKRQIRKLRQRLRARGLIGPEEKTIDKPRRAQRKRARPKSRANTVPPLKSPPAKASLPSKKTPKKR